MANFDVSTPVGSDLLSQGDDKIREFKNAMLDALRCGEAEGVESVFPGSSPSTDPVFHYRGLKGSTVERPTAGQNGLYFDTTRNVVQRDNGTSWDDIGTMMPAGTKIVFYQTSAPTGWTAVALNDKFLRVVTAGGTGGSTGGTVAASTSLSHSHTVASHTHTTPNHQHILDHIDSPYETSYGGNRTTSARSSGDYLGEEKNINAGSSWYILNRTENSGSGTSGASSPGTDSQLGAFAYADVIVASKD